MIQRYNFFMALCYGIGFGVNNFEKQIVWCAKAASGGHLEAQLTLAIVYEQGAGGVAKDGGKAMNWLPKQVTKEHKKQLYEW